MMIISSNSVFSPQQTIEFTTDNKRWYTGKILYLNEQNQGSGRWYYIINLDRRCPSLEYGQNVELHESQIRNPAEQLSLEASANHNGVMIAFTLRPELRDLLSVESTEPAENLHLTLLYLGESPDISESDLVRQVQDFASMHSPVYGTISGIGRFDVADSDSDIPIVALVDCLGLSSLRSDLVSYLGLENASKHDFQPHITLSYSDTGNIPDIDFDQAGCILDTLLVSYGDSDTLIPLQGLSVMSYMNGDKVITPLGNGTVGSQRSDDNGDWVSVRLDKDGTIAEFLEDEVSTIDN